MKNIFKVSVLIVLSTIISFNTLADKKGNKTTYTTYTKSHKTKKAEIERLEKNGEGAYITSVEWRSITKRTAFFIGRKKGYIKSNYTEFLKMVETKDFKFELLKKEGKNYYKGEIQVS